MAASKKKIFITGGKGFIGTNLAYELANRGHDVMTGDLTHAEDETHLRVDVANYRQLEKIFEKHEFDYVYHLAAEYGRWNGEDHLENLWATNAVGTKNVLTLQERHRFRLISFSSCEVYGDYDGIMSITSSDMIPIKQSDHIEPQFQIW